MTNAPNTHTRGVKLIFNKIMSCSTSAGGCSGKMFVILCYVAKATWCELSNPAKWLYSVRNINVEWKIAVSYASRFKSTNGLIIFKLLLEHLSSWMHNATKTTLCTLNLRFIHYWVVCGRKCVSQRPKLPHRFQGQINLGNVFSTWWFNVQSKIYKTPQYKYTFVLCIFQPLGRTIPQSIIWSKIADCTWCVYICHIPMERTWNNEK